MNACRIRLSRRPNWSMPPQSMSVARPHRWGNRYNVGLVFTAAEAVSLHRQDVEERLRGPFAARFAGELEQLRGRNLGCWCALCPDHQAGKPFGVACAACAPCHADTLGELANAPLTCEAVHA
ncbi:DUF4326 domain-containing protein [Pararoseomonas sp. SCSIO 73927]|uniref:DUF4326 domain-containing protein n=1 Tax=Pararoseomonas sp. SCSIO 73927 TaxID=3114537 RepID=UPI0030CEF6AD